MSINIGPMLKSMLERYGLGSLAPWISQRVTAGASVEQIELELYDRPEFISRFPAIRMRGRDGMPPLSVDEYLSFENSFQQVAKAFGITAVDKSTTDRLLRSNVSMAEAEERLSLAAKAVYQTDRYTRSELTRLYGVTTGDLVQYWLDPQEQLPMLQKRYVMANISGEAKRTGYDTELDKSMLDFLSNRGMTGETAAEAFGTLVQSEELFEAVDGTEEDITYDDQMRLITGDEDIGGEVRKRAGKRVAQFQEGGSFSAGKSGIAGLGKATS